MLRASSSLVAPALVLAGCDGVLGLNAIVPSPDVNVVTGEIHSLYPVYDANWQPSVQAYADPIAATSATLDDGTQVQVTYQVDAANTTGTFSFPLDHAGQAYRVVVGTGDIGTNAESAAPTLKFVGRLASRPTHLQQGAEQETDLGVMVAGLPVGDDIWLASTGIATDTATVSAVPTFSYDWRRSAFLFGDGMLDATDYHDRLYVLGMESPPSAPFTRVHSLLTADVDLVDGYPTPVTGAMTTVTPSSCVHVAAQGVEAMANLGAAVGGSLNATADWVVYAAPSTAQLGTAGAQIVAIAGYGPTATDPDLDVAFYNPFPGYGIIASMGASVQQQITIAGSTIPFTSRAGMRVWLDVPSAQSCMRDRASLSATSVAIPGEPTVAGVPISKDGVVVALPTSGLVSIQLAQAVPGPVDVTTTQLFELRSVSGITVPRLVSSTVSHGDIVTFDASTFVSGHYYALFVLDAIGYPNAGDGDFATLTFPTAVADTWSHYFMVQ